MPLNESKRFAFIPGGGSFMITLDWRRILTGIAGLASIVRYNRKFRCGVKDRSRLSSCASQEGARWTFFNKTHEPCRAAIAIACDSPRRAERSKTSCACAFKSSTWNSTRDSQNRSLAAWTKMSSTRFANISWSRRSQAAKLSELIACKPGRTRREAV